MEVIKLELPSEEEIEFQIALVDEPAIESDYMVFEKDLSARYEFKEFDKERRLLVGYAMIADLEIPRFSKERGAYKVIFPKESIDKIVRNFSKNGLNGNMNEMHNTGELIPGVFVRWQYQLDEALGLKAPNGLKQEAEGSWVIFVQCDDDETYQKAKDKLLRGFSIEGKFIEEEMFNKALDNFLNELDDILKN